MWQYDLQYSRDIGFGTFEVRVRKACTGHNPQEPKKIQIPACNVPAFKAGKKLKEAVNAKSAKKVRKNKGLCPKKKNHPLCGWIFICCITSER